MTKEYKCFFQKLQRISVATLSTVLFKKGLKNQVIQNVKLLGKNKKMKMVGPAFTLRYIPAREDRNTLEEFKNPMHIQRQAIENCPPGYVFVIDSRKDARAASAGDILITRLMIRGVAGIVTDGGFRDSNMISKLNFNSYHQRPASPVNLTINEAIDFNIPIGCGDVPVFPEDIIVGDADSVIVIPKDILEEITKEAFEMTLYEEFVVEKVKKGETIIGLYPCTKVEHQVEFEKWKKQKI